MLVCCFQMDDRELHLTLHNPRGWPEPKSAVSLASNSLLATLSCDSSLLSSYLGQLIASSWCSALGQSQNDGSEFSTQVSVASAEFLPAPLLKLALLGRGISAEPNQAFAASPELPTSVSFNTGAQGVEDVNLVLRLAWHAALCFAERASPADAGLRWRWLVAHAERLGLVCQQSTYAEVASSSDPAASMAKTVCCHLQHGLQQVLMSARAQLQVCTELS